MTILALTDWAWVNIAGHCFISRTLAVQTSKLWLRIVAKSIPEKMDGLRTKKYSNHFDKRKTNKLFMRAFKLPHKHMMIKCTNDYVNITGFGKIFMNLDWFPGSLFSNL